MNFSFRIKLILSIALLIVVILTGTSYVFLQDKEKDLSQGIFQDILTFSELTASKVTQAYDLYLRDEGYVYFRRAVGALYENNSDISDIRLVAYDGELLFDSATEKEVQYSGDKRVLGDESLLQQVQAFYPSVYTFNDTVIYIKRNEDREIEFVDVNERLVPDFKFGEQVRYFVQPVDGRQAVIYFVSYDKLNEQLADTRTRVVLMAVLGILLAILLAIFLASNFSRSIDELTQGAAQIAKGNFKYQVDVRTGDELEILGGAFNRMAAELEESTKAIVFKEKVAREIELAAQIQESILPKGMPKTKGLDIAAGIVPADEIGGDVYDFIQADEDNLMMYLGDVTGHGIPAGIVVSIANALFYSLAPKKNLVDILVGVNAIVKMKTTKTMFLTLCLLNWCLSQQKLSFVSAGHEKLLYYKAQTGQAEFLPEGGIALGMIDDINDKLKQYDITMQPGDAIMVYSDGIPEAWKNERENYGMARLKNIFAAVAKLDSAFAIKNAILADVKEFTAGYKQMDDITLLVLKKT